MPETEEQKEARESAERSAQGANGRRGPDGAKPGDGEPLPNAGTGYDANASAKAREAKSFPIGDRTFFRVRKTWDVSRALAKLLREQERLQDKALRLDARKDAKAERIRGIRDIDTGGWVSHPLDDDEDIQKVEDEVRALEDEIDTTAEAIDQCAYDMIRLLLQDPTVQVDDPEARKPSDEFLKAELAAEDAGAMVRLLTSGAEPDPTPTTPSSSTS